MCLLQTCHQLTESTATLLGTSEGTTAPSGCITTTKLHGNLTKDINVFLSLFTMVFCRGFQKGDLKLSRLIKKTQASWSSSVKQPQLNYISSLCKEMEKLAEAAPPKYQVINI